MESIKSWALTICFAALAAGMANIVAPKGGMQKAFKFAASLFFLCCVLIPAFSIKNIHLNLNLSQPAQSTDYSFQRTVNQEKTDAASEKVSALIQETCEKNGVTPLNVDTYISCDSSGEMQFKSALVVLKKDDMPQESAIEGAVKKDLGLQITIKEGERNGG